MLASLEQAGIEDGQIRRSNSGTPQGKRLLPPPTSSASRRRFFVSEQSENDKLDFEGTASEALIHRLADILEADEEELLLLAHHVPKRIADRIIEQLVCFVLWPL